RYIKHATRLTSPRLPVYSGLLGVFLYAPQYSQHASLYFGLLCYLPKMGELLFRGENLSRCRILSCESSSLWFGSDLSARQYLPRLILEF
ncbi:MAG: hypothetical protein WCD81_09465, partial [Candidatus Bathyarchaeia archaeon]